MAFDPTTRKHGIGASEAAACLGLSKWRGPLDVYIDKIADESHPRPDTAASKRGKRLEPIVLDMYEEEFGGIIRDVPQLTSSEYPFMFANLDAMRVDDGRPVEAKTAGRFVAHLWGEEDTDDIPTEYLIQVTHQAIVKGTDIADLAALMTLDDFRKYTIQVDPELAGMIVEGLRLFWQRVIDRDPPEPTSGEQVERFYKRSIEAEAIADEVTAAAFRELREVRAALKPLTDREARLTDDIKLFMRDRDTLIVDGAPACTWKAAEGGSRFDTNAFKSDHPELFATYQIQSQGSRRFIVKEKR